MSSYVSKRGPPRRLYQFFVLFLVAVKARWGSRGGVLVDIVMPTVTVLLFNIGYLSRTVTEQASGVETFNPSSVPPWSLFAMSPVYPLSSTVPYVYDPDYIPFFWSGGSFSSQPRLWYSAADGGLLEDAQSFMEGNFSSVSGIPPSLMRKFDSPSELLSSYAEEDAAMWQGVVFDAMGPDWEYRLLLNGSYSPSTEEQDLLVYRPVSTSGAEQLDFGKLIDTGMVSVQTYLNRAIAFSSGLELDAPLLLRAPLERDNGSSTLWIYRWLVGWCINIGLLFLVNAMLSQIVFQRSRGTDRACLLVGVPPVMYWGHWLCFMWLTGLVVASLLLGGFYLIRMVVYSAPGLVFLWLLLVCAGLGSVAVVFGTRITKPELASGVGLFGTFVFSGIWVACEALGWGRWVRTVLSVIPWCAVMNGASILFAYDYRGLVLGVQWDNAWEAGFTQLLIAQCVCLVLSVLYLLIITHKTPRRGFEPAQELSEKEREKRMSIDLPGEGERVVTARSIVKKFRDGNGETFYALKGMDLELLKGEILGLLGPNGAGKTTLISVLTGEIAADGGQAHLLGAEGSSLDLLGGERALVLPKMGVCQQSDALFDSLSGRENLLLFGRLKGLPSDALHSQVDELLKKFNLSDAADRACGGYSGGMRRKLSLGLALLGEPEVLLLDEPTAGLDPGSRRDVWECILKLKEGRAIVLTTHFMDEADLLSDRICMLRRGVVVAQGSPLALKHSLGVGYVLSSSPEASAIVKREVEARVLEEGELFKCSIPLSQQGRLAGLLEALAEASLPVNLSLTSIDEIFLKVTQEDENVGGEQGEEEGGGGGEASSPADVIPPSECVPSSPGSKVWTLVKVLLRQQFRYKLAFIFVTVLPLVYATIGLVVSQPLAPDGTRTYPPLLLQGGVVEAEGQAMNLVYGIADEVLEGNGNLALASDPPLDAGGNLVPSGGGYWLGGVAEDQGAFSRDVLQYNSSMVMGLPLLVDLYFASKLQEGNVSSSIKASFQPTFSRPIVYLNPQALLLPMMLGVALLPIAFMVIPLAHWKFSQTLTQLRLIGVSLRLQLCAFAGEKLLSLFLPTSSLILILAFALDSPIVGGGGRWAALVLLLVLFFLSIVPFSLMLFPLFSSEQQASDYFPLLWNLVSIIPYVIVWILISSESQSSRDAGETLGDVLCLLPSIAFQRGLQQLVYLGDPSRGEDPTWSTTFSWSNGVLIPVLGMLGMGGVSSAVLLFQTRDRTSVEKRGGQEALERGEVGGGIACQKLTKRFGRKTAVDGLSLSVGPSQIYGLLGPNGAGKSTTMRLLTGDLNPDSGSIQLAGFKNIRNAFSEGKCGYCPQFDGLFPYNTVREHFLTYAALKGVNKKTVNLQVASLARRLQLSPQLSSQSQNLSGGTQRKLSLALSLLGGPEVVLLDEPSTGVDPGGRRRIWEVLRPSLGGGEERKEALPSVLLSTHFMDEASCLSDCLGIMVGGNVRAEGKVAELNERFCEFSTLEVFCDPKKDEICAHFLKAELSKIFKNSEKCKVEEVVGGRVRIEVGREEGMPIALQLSKVFNFFEDCEGLKEFNIKHFMVSQMSLEQIFLLLTRRHSDEGGEEGVLDTVAGFN